MTTTISGTKGIDRVQDGTIVQADFIEIYGYSAATANTIASTPAEVAVSGVLVRAA